MRRPLIVRRKPTTNLSIFVGFLSESEPGNLPEPSLGDDDAAWAEIAVDETLVSVQKGHRLRHLSTDTMTVNTGFSSLRPLSMYMYVVNVCR